jgi:hypothetical protein
MEVRPRSQLAVAEQMKSFIISVSPRNGFIIDTIHMRMLDKRLFKTASIFFGVGDCQNTPNINCGGAASLSVRAFFTRVSDDFVGVRFGRNRQIAA